ncbi:helix-turn-helix domain-containing protein [Streptomyces sp. NPDC091204]|uniref:helix-turn-helix domain-containing protein n=1 Tax=Streptomyces sp. NPDC091204 TaxID=3155299 RepID=UPI003423C94B
MATGPMDLGPTSRAVADNLRRLREARGLSLRALSADLKRRGHSLSADALNKIENGRTPEAGTEPPKHVRRIDVDDLTALAAALDVNPNALLLPHRGTGSIDLTGTGEVAAKTVWEWAEGRHPLRVPEGDDGTANADFQRYARPLGIRSYDRTPASRAAHVEDSGGHGYYRRGQDGTLYEVGTGEQVEFDEHGNHDD